MKRNIKVYSIINLIVLIITAFLFVIEYHDVGSLFKDKNLWYILLIIVIVFLVHIIKASRLYLILYEYNIDVCTYTKIYCKVTPVSLVFPLKIGEFFRMYCYGTELESMVKGIVIIIFDRFMDTLALVTILLLLIMFNGGHISLFTYLLFLFLISILIIYLAYPGIYKFWKKYTLKSIATEKNLSILKILDIFNNIYLQITNISKGRGMILYCMSIIAWLCEIVGMVLLCGTTENIHLSENIINYLSSAMRKGFSIELQQFIFVSIILMSLVYLMMKFYELLIGKKGIQ